MSMSMEKFQANFSWAKAAPKFKERIECNVVKKEKKYIPIRKAADPCDTPVPSPEPRTSLIDTFYPTTLDDGPA